MVVIRSDNSENLVLQGFPSIVKDLSFFFHENRILVAAVQNLQTSKKSKLQANTTASSGAPTFLKFL